RIVLEHVIHIDLHLEFDVVALACRLRSVEVGDKKTTAEAGIGIAAAGAAKVTLSRKRSLSFFTQNDSLRANGVWPRPDLLEQLRPDTRRQGLYLIQYHLRSEE